MPSGKGDPFDLGSGTNQRYKAESMHGTGALVLPPFLVHRSVPCNRCGEQYGAVHVGNSVYLCGECLEAALAALQEAAR
jgi:hypothetical protein